MGVYRERNSLRLVDILEGAHGKGTDISWQRPSQLVDFWVKPNWGPVIGTHVTATTLPATLTGEHCQAEMTWALCRESGRFKHELKNGAEACFLQILVNFKA